MDRLAELLEPDDNRDALRKVGGLLIGIGVLLIWIRRSNPSLLGESLGHLGQFVLLSGGSAFLYGIGMVGHAATMEERSWQRVYVVFGIVLAPFAADALISWIDETPDSSIATFITFMVPAAMGAAAWQGARVRYALLAASIAVIVAWSALVDKILSGGIGEHVDAYRWLLLLLAVGLLGAAASLRWDDDVEAGGPSTELVTGAGIAAVLSFGLGLSELAAFAVGGPVVGVDVAAQTGVFWDAGLLVVSLALIGYGSQIGARGPAYVGAVGLATFAILVGLDLDADRPEGKILGWPLLVVALGAIAFIASLARGAGSPPSASAGEVGAEPPADSPAPGGAPPQGPPPPA